MTTPQLLQQAKQGDPDAIAQLMNQSLETKGIEATVSRQGDRLRVLLNSENELNQTLLTQFIDKGIQNLNIPDIKAVEVTGQSQSAHSWSQLLTMQSTPTPNTPVNTPLSSQATSSPPPLSQPTGQQNVTATATATAPIEPPAPISSDVQDDFDLSAPALDNEFSLDDELSMAEIDQIVADAVKEVTTKIQDELPFDVDIDTDGDDSLYGLPNHNAEPITESEIPTDEAIRQAMQTDDLDKFIDQELAGPNAVTSIEQDEVSATADSFQPLHENTVQGDAVSDDSEAALPVMSDFAGDAPMAARGDMDANVDINTGMADSSANDSEKSDSKVLLTLVSFITFGAIAALIGYSVQAWEGNLWDFPPTLSVQADNEVNESSNSEIEGAVSINNEVPNNETPNNETPNNETPNNEVSSNQTPSNQTPNNESTGTEETNNATDSPSGKNAEDELVSSDADDGADDEADDEADSEAIDSATTNGDEAQSTATLGTEASETEISAIGNAASSCPMDPEESDVDLDVEVTVSQIALNPDFPIRNDTYPVMGCLTNYTDTPIITAVIKYQGQPAEAAVDIVPVDEWSLSSTNKGISKLAFDDVDEIPANSTIVFTTEIPVAVGTTSIDLNSLAWRPEGWSGDAKSLSLNFSMPLTGTN